MEKVFLQGVVSDMQEMVWVVAQDVDLPLATDADVAPAASASALLSVLHKFLGLVIGVLGQAGDLVDVGDLWRRRRNRSSLRGGEHPGGGVEGQDGEE